MHLCRNFCKLDVLAVKSFVRRIESFDIQPAGIQAQVALPLGPPTPDTQGPAATHSVAATAATAAAAGGQGAGAADGSGAQGQQRHACSRVYAMTIRGSAFLWHQVNKGGKAVKGEWARRLKGSRPSRACQSGFRRNPCFGSGRAPHPCHAPYKGGSSACHCLSRGRSGDSSYLSHAACAQVRCMAAVLLLVGRGQEDPGIVATLLDVSKTPCKPQYQMAAEVHALHAALAVALAAWGVGAGVIHTSGKGFWH